MKRGAKKVVFEFLSIVIAVVLAMGLTEWRQDILNHRQAEESYQNIIEEIQNNQNNLLPDSANMVGSIRRIDDWLKTSMDYRDTIEEMSYELKLLSKSAWEVAKMNQSLTFIDNQRVLNASIVYEFHDLYVTSGRDAFASLRDLQKVDNTSPEYVGEMKALRVSLALTYNALRGYLEISRRLLNSSNPSSASVGE